MIKSSEVAYDNRMQFGEPNAVPATIETPVTSKMNKQSSSDVLILLPLYDFPRKFETSGKW
jgi:hypothetical protein